ncbi:MAG: GNAT family N-acetyltransferase [Candidatus Lokiarchaeota archaeon]|nr:GNAT family N-acetyltransferase [Candidatus Lokiarchaeota archaeon]
MSDEDIHVRVFNEQDKSDCFLLMKELCSVYHIEFDEARWRKSLDEKFQKSDGARMFVADKDGRAIGMLVSDIRKGQERVGYITNLVVAPEFRNKGVGERLIMAAMDYLRESHVPVVKANLRAATDSAMKFFMKMGFAEFAIQLRKDL